MKRNGVILDYSVHKNAELRPTSIGRLRYNMGKGETTTQISTAEVPEIIIILGK